MGIMPGMPISGMPGIPVTGLPGMAMSGTAISGAGAHLAAPPPQVVQVSANSAMAVHHSLPGQPPPGSGAATTHVATGIHYVQTAHVAAAAAAAASGAPGPAMTPVIAAGAPGRLLGEPGSPVLFTIINASLWLNRSAFKLLILCFYSSDVLEPDPDILHCCS